MKKFTSLLVAFSLTGLSFAQTFTNFTTSNGLLDNNVNCVDTDANDHIWFGTQSGVSVYDGLAWMVYNTSTVPGMIDNNILAIHCAANGDVWVGTDFGASHFSGGNWTSFTTAQGLANTQIKCIAEDASGNIWFGTNTGASKFDGTNFTNLGTAQGLPFGGVTEIDVHTNGEVWLGTGLSGVRLYTTSIASSITDSNGLIDNRIRGIVFDQQDKRWIATSEGISVFGNTNVFQTNYTTIFTLPPPDTLNPIEDIEMDSQGNMWVGVYVDYLVTEGGVCAYNGSQWLQYDVSDGLIGPVVRALAIDSQDNVWVATSTGVSKISDANLGFSKNEDLVAFSIAPNPAKEVFTVKVAELHEWTKVNVYNVRMQLMQSIVMTDNVLEINAAALSSGIYFVEVGGKIKKLIIQ
jgi:ligand-binding sensor domain-containing protein